MYEKMLVDTYPGFLSLRNEFHQIVWLNENFRSWIALYTDVDPINKTNTELAKLVPKNVADTFLQCHDGSLDLEGDSTREGLKKVIEFKAESGNEDDSQYFDVLKYKVTYETKPYIFTIAYDISDLYKENQLNLNTSLTDGLTKIKNRRYFEMNYNSFKGHCAAIVDLDNFKTINDKEGHLVGDEVLKGFCDFMSNQLLGLIHLVRLGGDEFLVLFELGYETTALEKQLIDTRNLFETQFSKYPYLSYSFGIGIIGASLEETLMKLDKQMYHDKNNKRGCNE